MTDKDNVQFGKVETTEVIDDQTNSTVTTTITNRNFVATLPIRRRYHMRIRVQNEAEAVAAYADFLKQLGTDRSMLEPTVEHEHNKMGDEHGYWYFVKCYTRLEY